MSYQIPPIGTVLPARENVNPTIPNPGPTESAVDFNEWAQAEAQAEAFRQNKSRKSRYLQAFTSWFTQTLPYVPDSKPPQPPAAIVVLAAPAEAAPVDFQPVPSGSTVVMPFTPGPDSLPEGSTYGPSYSTGPFIPVCATIKINE